MLSLFATSEQIDFDPKTFLRSLIKNSLDKGVIPNMEELLGFLPVKEGENYAEERFWYQNLKEAEFLHSFITPSLQELFCHQENIIEVQLTNGEKNLHSLKLTHEDWDLFTEILAMKEKQNWNLSSPFVSFYTKINNTSFRATLLHFSVSPEGRSKLFLRRLSQEKRSPSDYGNGHDVIETLFHSHENILIAGSTGSGKTSFLSSLLHLHPDEEHLLILEDTYEIMLNSPRITRLLADEKNPQKSLRSYMSYAMRMSPKRLVIGELRGAEVVPYMLAMNTGHKGLMSTVHASSAYDALSRLAMLFGLYSDGQQINYAQVMQLICRNIGYVVFMEDKKIKEVIKVLGAENGQAFYEVVAQF